MVREGLIGLLQQESDIEICGGAANAIDALELLQNDDTAAAIVILRTALLERVSWCGCSPGKCEGDKFLGCRSKSPLVK